MSVKQILLIVFALCVALIAGLLLRSPTMVVLEQSILRPSQLPRGQFIGYERKAAWIGDRNYNLHVADTPQKKEKGLSGTKSMESDEGMLFQFDAPGQYSFWMKDMHYSLDFIYIHNGEIVDIIENVSPDSYPEPILPRRPASQIIELNAGEVAHSGVEIGDSIELK